MKTLNSKSAHIVKEIARELILCEEGERIPTTPYFSEKFSVGFGTVDKVLTALKEEGIINLQSRGQMGTYLLSKKSMDLWNLAGYGILVGLLPLPNTSEYAGLATGFTEFFSRSGVTFSLNFKNGGKERIKSLLDDRCDFVILSGSAAEQALGENHELTVIDRLSSKTYYSGLDVIYRKNTKLERKDWKLGVDYTSYDHVILSEEEFPENKKVSVHYVNIPYLIADGTIDAALLHNQSLIPGDLLEYISIKPLEQPKSVDYLEKASAAVIITKKDRKNILALFKALGDIKKIEKIQREVIERKRVPTY